MVAFFRLVWKQGGWTDWCEIRAYAVITVHRCPIGIFENRANRAFCTQEVTTYYPKITIRVPEQRNISIRVSPSDRLTHSDSCAQIGNIGAVVVVKNLAIEKRQEQDIDKMMIHTLFGGANSHKRRKPIQSYFDALSKDSLRVCRCRLWERTRWFSSNMSAGV